ncbi:MAG: hypothetical protein H0W96_11925 [Solirubrobacterales bacterium]|nr:hypothetical protein [Solirubrobacterales bacterium]
MARSWSSRGFSKRGALAAIAVAGALAAGGCGDDDKKATATDDGLDKAQLVTSANAICKPHSEKVAAEAQKMLAGGKLPTPSQFGRLAMGTIIPEYKAQIAELRALKPADEVAAQYDAWLATSDATLARIQESPALLRNAATFKTVNGQADALGLAEECHVGPGG